MLTLLCWQIWSSGGGPGQSLDKCTDQPFFLGHKYFPNVNDIVVNSKQCPYITQYGSVPQCSPFKPDDTPKLNPKFCKTGNQYLYFVPNSDTTPTPTPSSPGTPAAMIPCPLPHGPTPTTLFKILPACRYTKNNCCSLT